MARTLKQIREAAKKSLHFVGFKDTNRYHRATQVFGKPDFVHRHWDLRARQEVAPGDKVVFAKGYKHVGDDKPSFDDSTHF